MTDTLTESFCERCGTRYELKAPTRVNPLRKTRGFIGGLRNYLTSQDDLSDAMGDAMRSEEDHIASAQLAAFHDSFNFCIDCRQYTCTNCWNEDAGRCRTCVPIPGTDDLAERLAASLAPMAEAAEPTVAGLDAQPHVHHDLWPVSDLQVSGGTTNGVLPDGWPEAELAAMAPAASDVVEPEPYVEPVAAELEPEPEPEPIAAELESEPEPLVADVEPEPYVEPVAAELEPEPFAEPEPVAAELEPEPEPELVATDIGQEPAFAELEPEVVIAAAELGTASEVVATEIEIAPAHRPLRVVAWDEDAASEAIEPEAVADEAEPEPIAAEVEPTPVVADVEPQPEPIAEPAPTVEPEPKPVAADAEPEPAAPTPGRIAPITETILRFPTRPAPAVDEPEVAAAAAAQDDSPEVAARRAQLDLLGLDDPGKGPVRPERSVLPYRSRGAPARPEEIAALAAGHASFWEASAREVAGGHVGVQSCGECGLSLSASARFCRRCGTRQARSA